MINWIFRQIFHFQGWKIVEPIPTEAKRCVLIAAPHTSNWDMVYTRACFDKLKIPLRFTIKKEWLPFPFGWILKPMGALGIDRSPKQKGGERPSMVEVMVELFQKHQDLCMLITPEGTRKKVTKWKTGFYYVALQAQVPIVCGYLDYKKKEAGMGLVLFPSGDLAEDMKKIMQFYKNITPKFPENFSLDLDYYNLSEGKA